MGYLSIDYVECWVAVAARPVTLTATEYGVFHWLSTGPGGC